MEIRLNPEQKLFAEAVDALAGDLAETWELGRGPDSVAPPVPDAQHWDAVAETGLLALRLDESAGGSAATCLDVCVAVEQLGRHSAPAPVIGTLLLIEQLRLSAAEPALVGAIASGRRRAAVTLTHDLARFATSPADAYAWDCAGAETAVCVESSAGKAAAYPVRLLRSADLTRSTGALDLDAGASETFAVDTFSCDAATRLTCFALALITADLLGVMQTALNVSVEHAKGRRQFGAPIGSFQAIQHLAAECLVSVEASRSALWYAAWAADELAPTEALLAARAAKAFASANAVQVAEAAIQIHGGMGMTWEARPHVWLRRIRTGRRLFGDENAQYAAIAGAQLGAGAGAGA
ncbi:MAG TPA: acyl-CoA dehydrogenase [Jatrophihabitans sp.]